MVRPRGYPVSFARRVTKVGLGVYGFLVTDFESEGLRAALAASQEEIRRLRSVIASQSGGDGALIGPGFSGLRNYTGQACFLNAALQLLLHCPDLRQLADRLNKLDPLCNGFAWLLDCMWSGDYPVLVARRIYGCIERNFPVHDMTVKRKVKPVLHHDTHDVFVTLLNLLHKGSNTGKGGGVANNLYIPGNPNACNQGWAALVEQESSPVIDIFGGLEGSIMRCSSCQMEQMRLEYINTLVVPMVPHGQTQCERGPLTLGKCLRYMTHEENIDDWTGCSCQEGRPVQATKKLILMKLPRVLVIQLKRFRLNAQGTGTVKLFNRVEIPLEGLSLDSIMPEDRRGQGVYDLTGVIRHRGNAHSGHYIADVLIDGAWFQFDDEVVTPIEQPSCGGVKRFYPYVLMYRMRDNVALLKEEGLKEGQDEEKDDEDSLDLNFSFAIEPVERKRKTNK